MLKAPKVLSVYVCLAIRRLDQERLGYPLIRRMHKRLCLMLLSIIMSIDLMQVVNRDLSVAVLKQFSKMRREEIQSGKLKIRPVKPKGPKLPVSDPNSEDNKNPEHIRILEGLAASGLRAIRYALEVSPPICK